MADKFFRLRRKQDGFQTDPITQKDADGIAGYPAEFEKVALPKGQSAILEGGEKTEEPATGRTVKTKAVRKPRTRVQARGASTPAATSAEAAEVVAGAAGTDTNEG